VVQKSALKCPFSDEQAEVKNAVFLSGVDFSSWPIVTVAIASAFRVMLTWLLLDVITDALEFEMV
jgi:hypothetical protein